MLAVGERQERVEPRRLPHRLAQAGELASGATASVGNSSSSEVKHDQLHVADQRVGLDHRRELQSVDVRHRAIDDRHRVRMARARGRSQHVEHIGRTAGLRDRHAAPRHLAVDDVELRVALHRHEHPRAVQLFAVVADRRLAVIDDKRHAEPKCRSLARRAVDANLAAHQFDQLL